MPPRPIHRRVSFWLGLFVTCFLFHAWFASSQRSPGIRWIHGMTTWVIYSAEGNIWIRKNDSLRHKPSKPGFKVFANLLGLGKKPRLKWTSAVSHVHHEAALYRYWAAGIAWWLIILLHLLAWLGTMTWSHRRTRRLLEKGN